MRATLTNRGWSLTGAALAMLVGSRVLGVLELAMLAAAAFVAIAVAVLRVRRHSVDFAAVRSLRPARAEAGAPARADLALTNKGARASRVLSVTDSFDGGARVARFLVPPMARGETTEAAYRLPTGQRGVYEIGPLNVSITDAFGLAERSMSAAGTDRFVVYPRIEQVLPLPGGANREARMGSFQASRVPVGMDFFGLREYEVGDDLRRVHWRSTARSGELMLRQDEMPWESRSTILLDNRPHTHHGDSFERAVEAAASLATAMCTGRRLTRFLTTSGIEINSSGADRYPLLMEYLAGAQPEYRKNAGRSDHFGLLIDQIRRNSAGGPIAAVMANTDVRDLTALGTLRSRAGLVLITLLRPSSYGGVDSGPDPIVPGALVASVTAARPFRDAWNQAVILCQRSATARS